MTIRYEEKTPQCQMGTPAHLAERNEEGELYLYATHSGTWLWACAQHSGMCHEKCWPDEHFPQLRLRTVKHDKWDMRDEILGKPAQEALPRARG